MPSRKRSPAYSLLTTNPVATIKDINSGVAGMIDGALAAEDTPAHVQVQRAASAVAHMSSHELGHAVGSTVGNSALAVAPGAALNKVARLRYLRTLRPRTVYEAPKIKMVKEVLPKQSKPWIDYNNGAKGAKLDQADAHDARRLTSTGKVRWHRRRLCDRSEVESCRRSARTRTANAAVRSLGAT